MKATQSFLALAAGLALLAAYAQSEPKPAAEAPAKAAAEPAKESALLWTYSGNYKMTPPPTPYSDLIRLKIQKVELLKGPEDAVVTKITYSPWYGKITAESDKFRKAHETQSVSFLLVGDHTAKVKEGDLLRTCFYPN